MDCDKNYLIHYRMLKFHVRDGMIVDKIHEITSFKQSKWLEKYTKVLIHKREIRLKMILKKIFYKLLNNAFNGKIMENVRNRLRLESIKNYENKKIKKQQFKLTFSGIHKSYENCVSY